MGLNELLARLLSEAGAVAFGSTRAEPVAEEEWRLFEQWLEKGYHAGMAYMRNYPEIRKDPRRLLEGAKTIISMAFNYRQPNPLPGVATYALGEDYHKVLRRRLKRVVKEIKTEAGGDWRICIDSAPVLERYWAVKCGVGFRSPVHGNVIVPGVGSMVFLAELITTHELDLRRGGKAASQMVDTQETEGPGVCPTGALQPGGIVDSRRCINYLTIEKRGDLTPEEMEMVGGAIFGCDICQRACRENRVGNPGVIPEFSPLPGLMGYLRGEDNGFELRNSPLSRAGEEALKRRLKRTK